jgi:putative Mg2+ transporter-C (MgtC) family protein
MTNIAEASTLGLETLSMRMLAALVCGAFVGFEREKTRRAAGLRTHILICLASAIVAMLTLEMVTMPIFGVDSVRIDPIRLIEAVTGGVAFLAAGLIVFTRGEVHGLTTGAGMWLTGAIGLACGLGLLQVAGLATFLAIIVLFVLARIEKRMLSKSGKSDEDRTDSDERHGY